MVREGSRPMSLPIARKIWNTFVECERVAERGVPLFATGANGEVHTNQIGKTAMRKVLLRSVEMEALIIKTVEVLVQDHTNRCHQYDGLLYLMHWRDSDGSVLPLYIGKAETIGIGNGNLSANLTDIKGAKGRFARWGDGYPTTSATLVPRFFPVIPTDTCTRNTWPGRRRYSWKRRQQCRSSGVKCSSGAKPGKKATLGSGKSSAPPD